MRGAWLERIGSTACAGALALLLAAIPAAGQEDAGAEPVGQQDVGAEPGMAPGDAARIEGAAAHDEIVVVDDFAPDTPEPGSVEAIREYTTDEDFLPRAVRYLPESETVPSPMDVLGRVPGAPDELSSVAEVHGYFRRLDEASDRVLVRTIGTSEEGREILLAFVSSAENLADLEPHAAAMAALADPRQTDRAEAERIARDGKPFYYLLAGLHSTETGSPEMVMELAYRLAVSDGAEIREIRDRLIVMITPVVEVDGRDRVVEWYYRHLRDRQDELPFEELREFSSPPYWGHYAFHDNNRDGLQLALALTRAVHGAYYEFHPLVVHDLHESLPLLYISTGHGPYNRAIDPITINEWTQFAHHEAGALQAEGLPGVWVWGFWDGWWPGYLFSVANNHHSIGRFYETFGNSLAGTFRRYLEETEFVGKPVVTRQWYRPSPPDSTVVWSLRNNTNYMEAGVLEALHYAALHAPELTLNFWTKGGRALERGRTESPYAWLIRVEQRDPGRLAYLVNQLRRHRIEVHRLAEPFSAGDSTWPAGTYAVRMDQPYRDAALMLLERQEFPEDEPNPPYDDVAWTWPLLYGVDVAKVDDRAVLEAAMEPVVEDIRPTGGVLGTGDVFLLADRGQTSLLELRVRLDRARIEAAEQSFTAGGDSFPAGSWIVTGSRSDVEEAAADLGLDFRAIADPPDVARHPIDLPRLGVYYPWTSTQAAGWVRYTLDQVGMEYQIKTDEDLAEGDIDVEVLLIPHVGGDFARLVQGIPSRYGPLAYTTTDRFPSHGVPVASDDITGGMGWQGMANLQRFVERGGIVIAIGGAGRLFVDGGIVPRVERAEAEVNSPGSEVRALVLRPEHPLAYGYRDTTSVFRGNLPLFEVDRRYRERVVLQFGTKKIEDLDEREARLGGAAAKEDQAESAAPTADEEPEGEAVAKDGKDDDAKDLVLSGFVKGKEEVGGLAAILDVPVGQGRVILFAFNPLHRYLNHSDFRFAWNAILNWNDLPR
ncbi:MAG: M14 family zinc carboxypeptidase [Gemmatimonadota bacterium]